jgi:hypothetical protein
MCAMPRSRRKGIKAARPASSRTLNLGPVSYTRTWRCVSATVDHALRKHRERSGEKVSPEQAFSRLYSLDDGFRDVVQKAQPS